MFINLGSGDSILSKEVQFVPGMDAGTRQKRVEALEAIKSEAMNRAKRGEDSLEVRDFVTEAKKEMAYSLPDYEAHEKAKNATLAYINSKQS